MNQISLGGNASPTSQGAAAKEQEKTYQIFHGSRQSMRMNTPEGGTIVFVGGKFITDNEDFIAYLQSELAAKNPFLSQKEEEKSLTSEDLDPMAALKKKHITEYLAALKEEPVASRDMGSTTADPKAGILSSSAAKVLSADSLSAAAK